MSIALEPLTDKLPALALAVISMAQIRWEALIAAVSGLAKAIEFFTTGAGGFAAQTLLGPGPLGSAVIGAAGAALDVRGGATGIGSNIMLGILQGMGRWLDQWNLGPWANDLIDKLNAAVGAYSEAQEMFPVGENISEGIAAGMQLEESMDFLYVAMGAMADALLVFAEKEDGPFAQTLWNVGKAFNVRIKKGIEDNVNIIVDALNNAFRAAQNIIGSGAWSATGGGSGPPEGPGSQLGGYSPLGGRHHAGELIIPAQITRPLMQSVSNTSNFNFNQNVASRIDVAHMNAMIRNIVRKELSRVH